MTAQRPERVPDAWAVVIDADTGASRGRVAGLRGLWRARGVMLTLIGRDVTSRYRRTVLGAAWAMVQPAIFTIVVTISVRRGSGPHVGPPYPIYVYLGFLTWTMFSSAMLNASHSVVAAQGLVSTSYFPRHVLPWAAVGVSVVDFLVGLVGLGVLMIGYRIAPSPAVFALPIAVVLIALAAGGVGSLLAGLIVRFRDLAHITPMLSLAWLFATPSLYLQPAVLGSPRYHGAARIAASALNPLSGLLSFVRFCTFGGPFPGFELGFAVGATIVLAVAGHACFARFEDRFVDVL